MPDPNLPATGTSPYTATHANVEGAADPAVPAVYAGHYELLAEIARGGMGAVYRARDRRLNRDLAIKVLREEFRTHPTIAGRFVEEAQICGQLQHPHIV